MGIILTMYASALACYALSAVMFIVAYVRSRHPHLLLMILWTSLMAALCAIQVTFG